MELKDCEWQRCVLRRARFQPTATSFHDGLIVGDQTRAAIYKTQRQIGFATAGRSAQQHADAIQNYGRTVDCFHGVNCLPSFKPWRW